MENKFFTFIKPYLTFIDKGDLYRTPFGWLYSLIAIINLFIPLYILFTAVDRHVFDAPARFVILFLISWIIIAFASWVSFQLWWDRKTEVIRTTKTGDEFVATPAISHLIQTTGEWLGTWIGIVGTLLSFFTTLFVGNEPNYQMSTVGVPFIHPSLISVIALPIFGFLIIVFTRFLAEQARAITSIANNTKKH